MLDDIPRIQLDFDLPYSHDYEKRQADESKFDEKRSKPRWGRLDNKKDFEDLSWDSKPQLDTTNPETWIEHGWDPSCTEKRAQLDPEKPEAWVACGRWSGP